MVLVGFVAPAVVKSLLIGKIHVIVSAYESVLEFLVLCLAICCFLHAMSWLSSWKVNGTEAQRILGSRVCGGQEASGLSFQRSPIDSRALC
jgi:hypothetical protein